MPPPRPATTPPSATTRPTTPSVNQTASGGLIGLNVNLGSPTNNSTGTATINTGAANASGNTSSTSVNQFCGEVGRRRRSRSAAASPSPSSATSITGHPIVVPTIPTSVVVSPTVATLARTGFESGMIVVAVALVLFGMAMLFTARRRLSPAGRLAGAVSPPSGTPSSAGSRLVRR